MNKRILFSTVILVLALLGLAACAGQKTLSPDDLNNLVATAAAQTVVAQMTQNAQEPVVLPPTGATATSQPVQPTNTPAAPTSTPLPPTATPQPPTPTATPLPCNAASFVKDVSIPDGTSFNPQATFTKTWRIKNAGSCTWDSSYALVYSSGEQMGGAKSVKLTGSVAPGAAVDLSVDLKAPSKGGKYTGYWSLVDGAGKVFGIGAGYREAFWVSIQVKEPTTVVYDFAGNACNALWWSGSGNLSCPGARGDSKGFVLKLSDPKLENGSVEDEPSLLTYPQAIDNGFISGRYPVFDVKDGDHFRALVNCEADAKKCNVLFKLQYRLGSGDIKELWSFNEAYDGKYYKADVDLSSLAGKSVEFILTVTANGSSEQDQALWVAPRIMR